MKYFSLRWIFALFVLLKLALAFFVPIAEDEAYYQTWSHYLDWGYLDHPPMVAWLGVAGSLDHHWFFTRLLPVIMATVGFGFFLSLFNKIYRHADKTQQITATLLCGFSFFGLLFGPLLTPDVAQTFFWILCLHEGTAALQGEKKRWLSAGAAAGFGLLSKYTMVLIAPVFVIGLWRGQRAQLKTIWPYAGMATAFLIFAPHLYWNAEHNWATIRFQLKRGLSNSHDVAGVSQQKLPVPLAYEAPSDAYKLGMYFDDQEFAPKPHKEKTRFEKSYKQVMDLVGSQLLMWGCILFCLIWLMVHTVNAQRSSLLTRKTGDRRSLPMISASIYVPLLFFGTIAFFTKVEANWPAVYVIGASLLLSARLAPHLGSVAVASAANITLIVLLLIHVQTPFLGIKPAKDRLLKETSGYQKMTQFIADQKPPLVLFDAYQLGAMLRFYEPQLITQQWAGITRVSEFVRRNDLAQFDEKALAALPSFDLLSYQQIPYLMPGFKVKTITEMRNCAGTDFLTLTSPNQAPYAPTCPGKTVRRWFLAHYEKE